MTAVRDLTGQRFGSWTVLRQADRGSAGRVRWWCRCTCGAEKPVLALHLVSGRTRQCQSCANTASGTTHGLTGTDLYRCWQNMLARCTRTDHPSYPGYGGRGIKVCDRWHTFELFAADMGAGHQPDLEIDRIDNDGHYEPGNCRWATRAQQARNRRDNHWVTWQGRTLCVTDWAAELGIDPNTLRYRLRRWPLHRAMNAIPTRTGRRP